MRVTSIAILAVLLLLPSHSPAAAPTSAPTSSGRSLKALRDEEQTVRQQLSEVKNALDQLSSTRAKSSDHPGLSRDARDRRLNALRDLRKKYESQIAELSASLAEKTAQLNEKGGEASKARVGAAELELADLLKQQFEAQREAERLSAAVDQHKGEAGKAVKQLEADRDQANAKFDKVKSSVANAKKQLAQLANQSHEQSLLLDSEKHARSRLQEIEREIEELELAQKTEGDPETARAEQQSQTLERAVQLNNMKSKYQFSLAELHQNIRDTEAAEIAAIFPDQVDVYLAAAELENNKPTIANARYDGAYELNSRTFVRLKNAKSTWTIDPTKIIAIKSHD